MLRKRVKDLEAEYKQLQLECQGKEGQVLALEKEVEVKNKHCDQCAMLVLSGVHVGDVCLQHVV